MPSPTARTLAHLRALGAMAEVVERYNPHARVRHDLYGFCDILAVFPDAQGCLAVQATSTANITHRLEKFREPLLAQKITLWLNAGNRLAVYGWAKRGPRGKVKHWMLKEVEVTAENLSPNGA